MFIKVMFIKAKRGGFDARCSSGNLLSLASVIGWWRTLFVRAPNWIAMLSKVCFPHRLVCALAVMFWLLSCRSEFTRDESTFHPKLCQSIKYQPFQYCGQNISFWMNQSINQSINQPTNQHTYQSINQSINQSTNQPTHLPINQSINQSIDQSNDWSNNQSINLWVTHSVQTVLRAWVQKQLLELTSIFHFLGSYGDKTPKSFLGRVYASLWMFIAMLLMSSFTAQISSIMTTDSLRPLDEHFGYKVWNLYITS